VDGNGRGWYLLASFLRAPSPSFRGRHADKSLWFPSAHDRAMGRSSIDRFQHAKVSSRQCVAADIRGHHGWSIRPERVVKINSLV
jgi:hypothetical protein